MVYCNLLNLHGLYAFSTIFSIKIMNTQIKVLFGFSLDPFHFLRTLPLKTLAWTIVKRIFLLLILLDRKRWANV